MPSRVPDGSHDAVPSGPGGRPVVPLRPPGSQHAASHPPNAGWHPTSLRHGDALAFAAGPTSIFVSISDEDRSTVYRSTDEGLTWMPAGNGLPRETSVAALLWHGERLLAGTVACGLYASDDAGTTWAPAGSGLPREATIFALAAGGDLLFAGTETAGLFRSSDGGRRWEPCNAGLPGGGKGLGIFALAADDSGLYAHHPFGLHRSADGGASWEALGGLPTHTALTLLAVHDGTLFASSPGCLYQSHDGGATWTAYADEIWKRRLVRALVAHDGILFAGTQGTAASSLYASADGGFTWTSLYDGLPDDTWSINPFAARHALLVGAGVHGVWRRSMADCKAALGQPRPAPPVFHLGQNDPNPFEHETHIPFTLPHPAHVVLDVCDLLGRPVATLLDAPIEAGTHRIRFDAGDLPGGFYAYRLTIGTVSQTRQMLLLR